MKSGVFSSSGIEVVGGVFSSCGIGVVIGVFGFSGIEVVNVVLSTWGIELVIDVFNSSGIEVANSDTRENFGTVAPLVLVELKWKLMTQKTLVAMYVVPRN